VFYQEESSRRSGVNKLLEIPIAREKVIHSKVLNRRGKISSRLQGTFHMFRYWLK